jgi:hypothetical protein
MRRLDYASTWAEKFFVSAQTISFSPPLALGYSGFARFVNLEKIDEI